MSDEHLRFQAPPGKVIMLAEVGSTLHGIAVGGQDDLDLIGVVVEERRFYEGLEHWETQVSRSKPEGVRSEAGDVDLTYHSLRKMTRLALKGNPTIIQNFWVSEPFLRISTPEWEEIRQIREAFISAHAGRAYMGYLRAQGMRLRGERGQKDVNRPELVEKYGYDTKYAAHACRLGFQGKELLLQGRISYPIPEAGLLRSIRTGGVKLHDVIDLIDDLEDGLFNITKTASKEPDFARIQVAMMGVYAGVNA